MKGQNGYESASEHFFDFTPEIVCSLNRDTINYRS